MYIAPAEFERPCWSTYISPSAELFAPSSTHYLILYTTQIHLLTPQLLSPPPLARC